MARAESIFPGQSEMLFFMCLEEWHWSWKVLQGSLRIQGVQQQGPRKKTGLDCSHTKIMLDSLPVEILKLNTWEYR